MHARFRPGCPAAAPASSGNQPDNEHPTAPAADRTSQSRRDREGVDIGNSKKSHNDS
jgi:hypothetical protein